MTIDRALRDRFTADHSIGDAAAGLQAPASSLSLVPVRVFVAALVAILAGYMFMGRGFAHVGVRPVYVGEVVLVLGLIATAYALLRLRLRVRASPVVLLLLALMVWGAIRTLPYLGAYGVDALRDATLWGYASFALMVYVLADRGWLTGALRLYGWVVPVFALWLPIALALFGVLVQSYDSTMPGSNIPLVFWKNQDMAVHAVGAIAFLVLCTDAWTTTLRLAWRTAVAVPLAWILFITGTASRGAIGAMAAGLGVAAVLTRSVRNWLPIGAAAVLALALFVAPSVMTRASSGTETPDPGAPTVSRGWLDNITSVVGPSSNEGLEGTKQFRLAWWTKIVDYTVFGPYFWDGKGFGVNLADDDGFQPTADGSLRAPHNSHLSFLARSGVPGFALWVIVQGAFGVALLLSVLAHRRAGDKAVAAVGAWILVYWTAMHVNTSFDPYLEGPQGGIWFWTLFGLGLVVIRLAPSLRWR